MIVHITFLAVTHCRYSRWLLLSVFLSTNNNVFIGRYKPCFAMIWKITVVAYSIYLSPDVNINNNKSHFKTHTVSRLYSIFMFDYTELWWNKRNRFEYEKNTKYYLQRVFDCDCNRIKQLFIDLVKSLYLFENFSCIRSSYHSSWLRYFSFSSTFVIFLSKRYFYLYNFFPIIEWLMMSFVRT